jgi:hypothetical protein
MRQESDAELERRIAEYKKDIATRQKLLDEQFRQYEEVNTKVGKLNQRIVAERARMESRRVIGKERLMCVVAKFGPKGNAFAPRGKVFAAGLDVGRLYLQSNDLDLDANSGALDVEIEFHR